MQIDKALSNPSALFQTPGDVLVADLSQAEKIKVLRQWEYDEREREVAEEENMGGGDDDRLSGVLKALDQLGQVPGNLEGPTGKQGGD
jgi:hypothetical protein